ncbi:hypothetical protein BASA60_007866 [Batrachochytrium salamandrivorans]|nr:hypothetical protein BASA60_007866 [Batrachochytrium salamandrivorans]
MKCPGKLLNGLMKLKKQSFELRRVSLEKYLQSLLHHMEICKSVEFRKFLCHPKQGSGVPPTSATDAIIDVFIEIFELKEKNNWLRRQAVVLFLQQLFGGTVERRVNELLRWVVCEENTAYMLTGIIGTFWPKGVWDPQLPTRTIEDKRRSRLAAQGKLATLLPEMLGGVVGRQNAKRGALRWCSLFQNRRLNQHLVYTIMDDLLVTLFPETSN